MKKGLVFLIIICFIFPLVSAANINMDSEYKKGETIIASVNANFLNTLSKSNIYFYRGNVQTSFDYSVGRVGQDYYIYAQTDKSPNDYMLQIKNIKYIENGKVVENPIEKEFTITSEQALFSVEPGLIITDKDFYIDVRNPTINNLIVKIESFVLSGSSKGDFNFAVSGYNPSNSLSFEIIPGARKRVNVLIEGLSETTIRTIQISSGNTGYNIPAYVILKNLPPEPTPEPTPTPTPTPEPECINDGDCYGDEICQNQECVDPPETKECYGDKECPGENFICQNYICVYYNPTPTPDPTPTPEPEQECITNLNCAIGEMCKNGVCIPDPNYGITCENDYECYGGKVCRNGLCVILPSTNVPSTPTIPTQPEDSETPSKPVLPTGCLSDTECKGERVCRNGECTYYDGTSGTDETPSKDIQNYGCLSDTECKGERVCSNGKCVYPEQILEEDTGCKNDSDCKGMRICKDKICVFSQIDYNEIDCVIDDNCYSNERCINNKCVLNEFSSNTQENKTNSIIGEEYSDKRDYDFIVGEDGETFAVNKKGEVLKEPVILKTCKEIQGKVCTENQICEGEAVRALDSYCCVGSCVKESPGGNNKLLGYVLIGIIILLFLLFLSKYNKTKRKKFSVSELSKRRL